MRYILNIILAATLTTNWLSAEVVETNNFSTLLDYANEDTLVLIDIDNTLIRPTQYLGSDMWFKHRHAVHQKEGMLMQDALEEALAEWMSVQSITKVQLVEKTAVSIIEELQKKGIPVIGFTTRGLGHATRTIFQLRSLSVNLEPTAIADHDFFFDNGQGTLFRKGILFTAGSDKGTAFKKLMEITKTQPKSVVFINDKYSHIAPVEAACTDLGIPFTGLRYGAADEWMKAFDPAVAGVQFLHFGEILSDEQAVIKLKTFKEALR